MATDGRDQAAHGTRVTQPTGGSSPRGRSPLLWASLRAVLDELGGSAPRVLDCGGGSGSLAVPLAAQGALVTVVDVSIDALSTLMRRAAESGVPDRITAVQGDAESLADLVPVGAFDLVLAHDLVADLLNPAQAVRQMATVLRPGGVLSLVVVNPVAAVLSRVLVGELSAALTALHRPADQSFDVDVLSKLCLAAGLQIRSVEGLGVFTDLVPGIELERPGAMAALSELEAAVAAQAPYRDIASRLHLLARRPSTG